MPTNQKLSSLSIAAIALMAAAAPGFAQVSSNESRPETVAPVTELVLATNRPPGSVVNVAPVASEQPKVNVVASKRVPSLSAETFKISGQSNAIGESNFLKKQPTMTQRGLGYSKTQFKVDSDEVIKTRRIEFVPSRGQKLPE